MSVMSSFLLHQNVLFGLIGWFVRWEVSACTFAVLWGVASRFCSKQYTNETDGEKARWHQINKVFIFQWDSGLSFKL